jgi:Ca2+:H+ antiporter
MTAHAPSRTPAWRAFVRSPVNWLLAGAPAATIAEHSHAPAPVVFLLAGLTLVPLATLIVHATEEIAARTGPAIGGLLNATFGNLPELIISFVALRAGLLEMVRASLIGALLANLLLSMGVAFLVGGARRHEQLFNPAAARTYSSIMLLAALSMVGPASFHRFFSQTAPRHAAGLDTGVAIVLLVMYALYLVFMLRTHPDFFRVVKKEAESHGPSWSTTRAVTTLVIASAGAAWMSEMLVGAAEATGQALGMSQGFIGIILLAILGGAAESGAAVAMAKKDQMDLSVGIAMGSSIQIALFVTPVLVLSSRFVAPERLTLSFTRVEIGALFLAVLIGITIASDGRANWFKGAQLVGFYVILAALFYLLPGVETA